MTSPALMAKTSCFSGSGVTSDPLLILSNSNNALTLSFMGDEGCSDLSGSSSVGAASPQSPMPHVNMATTGMSPTFNNADEDLNFWELAINSSSSPPKGTPFGATTPSSTVPPGGFISTRSSFSLFNDEETSPLGKRLKNQSNLCWGLVKMEEFSLYS